MFFILLCFIAQPVEARRKKTETIENREKRDFRGVWLQTAFQERYTRLNTTQIKEYLLQMVDDLQDCGINTIMFQVRPEGDAFYRSEIEPWSRFLTGKQGSTPVPEWDPMQYMIDLCHERQMEFHAWINPYRMCASKNMVLPQGHLYYEHPDWFVHYDGRLYLNPGMPECRSYVRSVVKDIVSRYDVDALHIDDYFYPYPIKGMLFDDRATFEAYAPQMNLDTENQEDWNQFRRQSVNILIKAIHNDIQEIKPWVRFGVSPFGIYRNEQTWENGSKTTGIQCYDELFADVLLWAAQGWVDYIIPQLYWEIGYAPADYSELVKWWNDHTPDNCHLYIGQSIERSLDETDANRKAQSDLLKDHKHFMEKLNLAAQCTKVRGNSYWFGYQIEDNLYHVRDFLKQYVYNQGRALHPAFTHIDAEVPAKVVDLKIEASEQGPHLSWKMLNTADALQAPKYFCVYRFEKGEKVNIDDVSHLLLSTPYTDCYDTQVEHAGKYVYVVTAIDACNNESTPVRKIVKVKKH